MANLSTLIALTAAVAITALTSVAQTGTSGPGKEVAATRQVTLVGRISIKEVPPGGSSPEEIRGSLYVARALALNDRAEFVTSEGTYKLSTTNRTALQGLKSDPYGAKELDLEKDASFRVVGKLSSARLHASSIEYLGEVRQ